MLTPAVSFAADDLDPAEEGRAGAPMQHQRDALRFDMPAQPLHKALQFYSEMTGRSVLYDTRQVSRLNAPALRGSYTPDDALRRLIAHSGLQAYFASHDVFMLKQAVIASDAAPQDSASLSPPAWWPEGGDVFYGEVQARITRVLCDQPVIRQEGVRMILRFGLDAGHAVSGLRVHVPDRPVLALRVRQWLEGLPLMPPPGVSAQSVIMVVQPASQDHWQRECS